MKLVNGQTLSALLEARSDPLSERRRFLAMFEQVCQAVAYAHSRGVIHRDLKPANVMVGTFGEVQVMDWGLSRVLSGSGRKSAPEGNLLLGTPAYMPPEQARGRVDDLDERSDVFGLGAILCELLTGKPPYTGTGAEVRRKAAQGDLAEAEARLEAAGVDAELLSIARKFLSPAPADRFADAGELARDFTAYLGSVEERARAAVVAEAEARGKAREERRARRLTLYLAVAILAATILGTVGYLVMENDRRQRGRAATGEVARALEEARLHWGEARAAPQDFARWGKAMSAARSAQSVARAGGVDAVTRARVDELLEGLSREEAAARQGAAKREAERRVVEALDDLRLRRDDLVRYGWNRVDEEYARAFRDFGLEVDSLSVDDAAQRIRGSARSAEISSVSSPTCRQGGIGTGDSPRC